MAAERAAPEKPAFRPAGCSRSCRVLFPHSKKCLKIVLTRCNKTSRWRPAPKGRKQLAFAKANLQRLLRRSVTRLGARFADYAVVDGEFATAPFLHCVGDVGLRVVARWKGNLPELFQAAQRRFRARPPHTTFRDGPDRVEVWDADDFDPWEDLRWETVRVIFYRQHKPHGELIEAFWLTDFPSPSVGSHSLYDMAKSRWEIENQGFNEANNRHGLEHISHHRANSLLMSWLLTLLALTIERLDRLRYLHRGTPPARTAIELVLLLWLSLSRPLTPDTS